MGELSKDRPATVLVATEGDWAGRALESVLTGRGYAVQRTRDGREAVRLARRTKPDAVITDQHTAELGGIEICRQLRDDPTFDPATPLIVIAGSPVSQADRSAAYEAGAWALWSQPLDTNNLLRELTTFVRAKRGAAPTRDESLVDSATGMLSPVGMERWAEKLAAVAVRKHEPLACVVLMAVASAVTSDSPDAAKAAQAFVELSRAHMRQSDVIGWTAEGRLAMLAPDTDGAGVLGFVQRLRSAIDGAEAALLPKGVKDFRAGYYALDDFASASVEPSELIRRASKAVVHAHQAAGDEMIFSFNQLPLN